MNFKNIKTIAIIGFLVTTLSCSIDEIQPINQLNEGNVIRDENSALATLNRVYNIYRDASIINHIAASSISGTEMLNVGVQGAEGWNINDVKSNSQVGTDAYITYYAVINHANFFIELVEAGNAAGISETRKNELLAEAKGLRAIAHFNLLRIFGQFYDVSSNLGIIVRTTPARTSENLPRNTVQETYNGIISDLEFTIANAATGREHFYISPTFAKALLSKTYLYMGDFEKAATTAKAVIDNASSGFSLAPVYDDIFIELYGSETLFAPFVSGFDETANTDRFLTLGQITPTSSFRDLADAQDGVIGDGDIINNASGYDPRFIFAYNQTTPNFLGNTKYGTVAGSGGNTAYTLRMAEIYLIHAEAEARRTGGDLNTALSSLNAVRNRVSVALKTLTNKATLLEDIRNEKMLELFSENGESWFDLTRYDRLGDLSAATLKPTISSTDKLIAPIPLAALAGNTALTQNPSY